MIGGDARDVRAREICSHLLIFPYLPREKYRDLILDDDLREDVQARLEAVGMRLAESFYSDFFSVRLDGDIEADIRFDWATNHRLPRGAQALLVVLWAKLVLPRRAARDKGMSPQEQNLELFEEDSKPADYVVKVAKEAVLAEFQARFGRTNLLRYIGQLKRLGFVKEDRAGRLFEGPMLDLMVDGRRLASEIQRGALSELLSGDVPVADARPVELELDDASGDDDDAPLFDLTTGDF